MKIELNQTFGSSLYGGSCRIEIAVAANPAEEMGNVLTPAQAREVAQALLLAAEAIEYDAESRAKAAGLQEKINALLAPKTAD